MTGATRERLKLESDAERGRGEYPAYHALWPLSALGVVEDLTRFQSEGWAEAAKSVGSDGERTRIALIDTSVAAQHPNLREAVDMARALDLFTAPLGVAAEPEALSKLLGAVKNPLPDGLPAAAQPLWGALLAHLRGGWKENKGSPVLPATSPSFSAHGTAMAGLIGARPVSASATDVAHLRLFDPESGEMTEMSGAGPVAFAFAGVDPFCEIVPISTHFDPEPNQLLLAMLYAVMIEADIIVLARDFASPRSLAPHADQGSEALGRALGVGLSAAELEMWDLLGDLTIAISKTVPVICAAGNGAQEQIPFPGDLATEDNGLIVVGARTAAGTPASYSPVTDAVTVYAPSGDGERLDRELQRLDVQSAGYNPNEHGQAYSDRLENYADAGRAEPTAHTHVPMDLVSTDVPGRAGYNSSPNAQVFGRDGAILDYRSAYCRFSGTSGAVALTAGLVSLGMSAGRLARRGTDTGTAVKMALTGGQPSQWHTAQPAVHWSKLPAGADQ